MVVQDVRVTDRTVDALDGLAEALEIHAREVEHLADRVELLQKARSNGEPWFDILSKPPGEGSMQLLSETLARMSEASGALRKAVVEDLRRDGVSIPGIADLLGVTHQRISNILRRSDR